MGADYALSRPGQPVPTVVTLAVRPAPEGALEQAVEAWGQAHAGEAFELVGEQTEGGVRWLAANLVRRGAPMSVVARFAVVALGGVPRLVTLAATGPREDPSLEPLLGGLQVP
ncbi:MAG: hypothetical protein R3F59_11465 [Myxococcota bacterium]